VRQLRTAEDIDITRAEDEAFWTWTIVETLRHTGIRHEELLELTHLALVTHILPDTGEVVPLLQIAPSKLDKERVLLVSPELAHVLARVVHRVRDGKHQVPLVARYDGYERVTGPPLPHLFQRHYGTELRVMSPPVVHRLLRLAVERAALVGPDGAPLRYTPHDFRRIFATDAVSGGLPVQIAAKLLGHADLSATQIYVAVYQDDVIRHHRAFIARRRALRPSSEYREPTPAEWKAFEQHFAKRKVELGTCMRPYGSPCQHEHASDAPCCGRTRRKSDAYSRSSSTSTTASAKHKIAVGWARSTD
jgi:integrase